MAGGQLVGDSAGAVGRTVVHQHQLGRAARQTQGREGAFHTRHELGHIVHLVARRDEHRDAWMAIHRRLNIDSLIAIR